MTTKTKDQNEWSGLKLQHTLSSWSNDYGNNHDDDEESRMHGVGLVLTETAVDIVILVKRSSQQR